MKNIVVFASGSGSNFQSIIDAVESGDLNARIAGLISNKHGVKAVGRAAGRGIPYIVMSENDFEDYSLYEIELLNTLAEWDTDLIVLAGYLRKIPLSVIKAFKKRILNIHPSLLPKYGGKGFYGMNVHQAVIESGDSQSGCSVHVVTEEYDEGPILEQSVVDVAEDDNAESLAKKVLKEEHRLYPKVIANYLTSLN